MYVNVKSTTDALFILHIYGDCKHVKLKLHVYFSELQDFGSNGEEIWGKRLNEVY